MYVFVVNVPDWRVESLVATSFVIVDVLSNDFPVFEVEHLLPKYFIGLKESIENESIKPLASAREGLKVVLLIPYLCVIPSRSV